MDEPKLSRVAVLALEVFGLLLLSIGAGLIYPPAGLIVAGLGCVVLGWRLDSDAAAP